MACKIEDGTPWGKVEPQENQTQETEDSKEDSDKNNHIIAKKQPDFSNFEENNWIRQTAKENKVLQELNKKGGAVWVSPDGSFKFRRSIDDTIRKLEPAKMKMVLCNTLDRDNLNIFSAKEDAFVDIKRNELLMCEDVFTPFEISEFYQKDGIWCRTSFRPRKYLQREASAKQSSEPKTILWLMQHLCNGNEVYFKWFINWVAYFFQTLEKSQVSLLLKGAQGTGKGIFFEKVLSKLFGEKYCAVIDDDRLGSSFKNWVSDTIFYNLNEISHDMRGRKVVKNFIKQLVTDSTIQTEKKYENASKTEIYGNVLITSNENYPIEIEPSDRRYCVFSTGTPLKKIVDIDTSELIYDINRELESFAVYLKSYKCDIDLYHTAIDTPEKQALIDGTTDRFSLFVRAILDKNLDYFNELEEDKFSLYQTLVSDFEKDRICQSDIKPIFDELFEDDIPSKTLLGKIRAVEPLYFPSERKKLIKSNGKYYYSLK